jgi:hypothetical protein
MRPEAIENELRRLEKQQIESPCYFVDPARGNTLCPLRDPQSGTLLLDEIPTFVREEPFDSGNGGGGARKKFSHDKTVFGIALAALSTRLGLAVSPDDLERLTKQAKHQQLSGGQLDAYYSMLQATADDRLNREEKVAEEVLSEDFIDLRAQVELAKNPIASAIRMTLSTHALGRTVADPADPRFNNRWDQGREKMSLLLFVRPTSFRVKVPQAEGETADPFVPEVSMWTFFTQLRVQRSDDARELNIVRNDRRLRPTEEPQMRALTGEVHRPIRASNGGAEDEAGAGRGDRAYHDALVAPGWKFDVDYDYLSAAAHMMNIGMCYDRTWYGMMTSWADLNPDEPYSYARVSCRRLAHPRTKLPTELQYHCAQDEPSVRQVPPAHAGPGPPVGQRRCNGPRRAAARASLGRRTAAGRRQPRLPAGRHEGLL